MFKRMIWFISLISLLLFLIFIPRAVMYPDFTIIRYIVYGLLFGLIFGLLPFLVIKTVKSFNPETPWSIILALISPLIIGPSFGLFHDYNETLALEKNGNWTKAVVIKEKYVGGKTQSMMIKCSYIVNNVTYITNFEDDKIDLFSVDDSLELIYLDDFPKIYRLGYEWKNK